MFTTTEEKRAEELKERWAEILSELPLDKCASVALIIKSLRLSQALEACASHHTYQIVRRLAEHHPGATLDDLVELLFDDAPGCASVIRSYVYDRITTMTL